MSKNDERYGLTKSMKAMLIVIGILLAILVVLVWAFILKTSQDLVSDPEPTEATVVKTRDPDEVVTTEEEDTEADAALSQAHDKVADLSANPACADSAADTATLTDFVERKSDAGGMDDQATQLVADALQRINSVCERDYVAELKATLASPTTLPALTAISVDTDWVTKARPPLAGSVAISEFATNAKNIHCALETERVACTIFAYSYPSVPDTCEGYPQTFIIHEAGDTERDCSFRVQAGQDVGDGAFHNDDFACEVRSEGTLVECWSQLTGHGFATYSGEAVVF